MISRIIGWLDRLFSFRRPHRRFLVRPLPEGINYFYCFGGVTFTLILVSLFTGLLLSVYYVPSPAQAFDSVEAIKDKVYLGSVIRAMHKWAANLMVITLLVHMIRVFVAGAYRHPRELNWVVGVLLLALVLSFAFTGYLLPWNQKAYWATVVGTSMPGTVPFLGRHLMYLLRGGEDVTGATLLRFYSIHTQWLPVFTGLFLWAHFHMVKRRGIAGGL